MNVQNAIRCPDGKLLVSTYAHDYVTHKEFMVDGGLNYFRSGTNEGAESLYLDQNSSLIEICDKLICERLGILWKDISTNDAIQEERINIMEQWMRKRPVTLASHTMHHALLHMYVGGYWMVKNTQNTRLESLKSYTEPTKPANPAKAKFGPPKKKLLKKKSAKKK